MKACIYLFGAALLMGCSTLSLEGRQVGGCTLHQANSLTAGVAWAQCPSNAAVVYLPGQSTGYAEAAGPAVGAAGTIAAAGVIGAAIPKSFTLQP